MSSEFKPQNNISTSNNPDQAFLVLGGMLFPLPQNVFKIGRNLSNDLVLNDPTISRFHAEIHYMNNQYILIDKNSSSGTFLNNKRIEESALFAGDIIQVAHTPIMFMFKGASITAKSMKNTGQLKSPDIKITIEKATSDDLQD